MPCIVTLCRFVSKWVIEGPRRFQEGRRACSGPWMLGVSKRRLNIFQFISINAALGSTGFIPNCGLGARAGWSCGALEVNHEDRSVGWQARTGRSDGHLVERDWARCSVHGQGSVFLQSGQAQDYDFCVDAGLSTGHGSAAGGQGPRGGGRASPSCCWQRRRIWKLRDLLVGRRRGRLHGASRCAPASWRHGWARALRRAYPDQALPADLIRVGDYEIDPVGRTAMLRGQPVTVAPRIRSGPVPVPAYWSSGAAHRAGKSNLGPLAGIRFQDAGHACLPLAGEAAVAA